jgi:hypothetical protein
MGSKTSSWSVQELWAQIAWRIVEDNCNSGEAFAKSFRQSPAEPYAFVIEILCVAFHSIAHRSRNSIWDEIINGPPSAVVLPLYDHQKKSYTILDLQEDQGSPCATSDSDLGMGDEDEYEQSSKDFNDSAYEGSDDSEDDLPEKQQPEVEGPSIELGAAIMVRLCDARIQPLHMIDESGDAITGYYTRSKVVKG